MNESAFEGLDLQVSSVEYTPSPCDGCGERMAVGTDHLAGIESCCGGGCWRLLCFSCLKRIAQFVKDNEL